MVKLSGQQLMLLVTVWTGIFCNYICYSVIAPFFPQLARKKGLSTEQYSFVFGIYSIAQVLLSCLTGKLISQIGPKFVLVCGLFLTGGATVLFGCLDQVRGGPAFLALSCSIRAVEGAGFAAYLTSVLTLVVEMFPTDPGYYVGLTESVVTVGMIAGPPLGSILYVAGGYVTSFAVFGSIILATGMTAVFSVTDPDKSTASIRGSLEFRDFMKVLHLTETIIGMLCTSLNVVADTYILITLTSHLQQFQLSQMEIGGVYLCLFLSYGISSPLAGRIADQMGSEFLLQAMGSATLAVSFLLVGPATFMPLKCELWLIIVALLLKGVGAGPLISCSYSACLKAARFRGGMPDDFRTYSLISSVISFSIPLGNLLGSFTAGMLYDHFGMQMATTFYACIFSALGILCLIAHLCGYQARGEDSGERASICDCCNSQTGTKYGTEQTTTPHQVHGILLSSFKSEPAIL